MDMSDLTDKQLLNILTYEEWDKMAAFNTWPQHYKDMGASTNLNNNKGFRLGLFMLENGVEPKHVRHALVHNHNYLPYQADYLIRKWVNNEINATTYVVGKGVVTINST